MFEAAEWDRINMFAISKSNFNFLSTSFCQQIILNAVCTLTLDVKSVLPHSGIFFVCGSRIISLRRKVESNSACFSPTASGPPASSFIRSLETGERGRVLRLDAFLISPKKLSIRIRPFYLRYLLYSKPIFFQRDFISPVSWVLTC